MVKNLPAKGGDMSSIPGLGRSLGGGNGNPLQYSCLENSMDRGAWRATVHGVAKDWAQLSLHAPPKLLVSVFLIYTEPVSFLCAYSLNFVFKITCSATSRLLSLVYLCALSHLPFLSVELNFLKPILGFPWLNSFHLHTISYS